MRKPQEGEYIVCPEKNEKLTPKEVWDTKGPDGKHRSYGISKKHHHYGSVCPRSGLAEDLHRESKSPQETKPTEKPFGHIMAVPAIFNSDYTEEMNDFWEVLQARKLVWGLVD